ncbi:MAG: right-handed parallel beta-helix repeat-containing protein [Desulfobacteraceae bacterium]|nr:right-handed parallel beta-helix repeat-containing protein [Desulfobacteraceae bacterium]
MNELKLWIDYHVLPPLSSINSYATHYRVSDSNDVYLWRCSVKSSGSSLIIERSNGIEWAEGKTISGISEWGVDIVSSRALLSYGVFKGGNGGLLVRGGDETGSAKDSSNVTVIQSTIRSAHDFGITLLGPSHLSLQRNIIRENQGGGIYSRGGELVAKKNKITGNGTSGVVLKNGGSATLIDNIFAEDRIAIEATEGVRLLAANNTVYGGETGFQITNAYLSITGNRLQNPSKVGIYLLNPREGWSIDSNTITGSEAGILVAINNESATTKSACNKKESCIISKNLIFENAQGVVAAGPQGGMIWLRQNTIVKNRETGVLVSSDGSLVFIDRNILAFNGGGILDPKGLVTIKKSVGFDNQFWDEYPQNIPRQGKLFRANPRFRNMAEQDFRPDRTFMFNHTDVGAFTEW